MADERKPIYICVDGEIELRIPPEKAAQADRLLDQLEDLADTVAL